MTPVDICTKEHVMNRQDVAALQEIASRYETAENTNTSIATERKY